MADLNIIIVNRSGCWVRLDANGGITVVCGSCLFCGMEKAVGATSRANVVPGWSLNLDRFSGSLPKVVEIRTVEDHRAPHLYVR
jgi:hypothetical protein